MCAQALTGCPARSGSSPAAVSRGVLLEFAQALGLGRGTELGGVGGGQVIQPGADHVQRLTGICRGRCTHLVTSSPGLVAAAGAACRPREGQVSRI
jgi:hypothetical protein